MAGSFFEDAVPPPPLDDLVPDSEVSEEKEADTPTRPRGAQSHDPRELSRRQNRRKGLIIGSVGALGVIAMVVFLTSGGAPEQQEPVNSQAAASAAVAETGIESLQNPGNTGLGIDTVSISDMVGSANSQGGAMDVPEDLAATLNTSTQANLGPTPSLPDLLQTPNETTTLAGSEQVDPPATAADSSPKREEHLLDLTGGIFGNRQDVQPQTDNTSSSSSNDSDGPDEEARRARLDSLRLEAAAAREARLERLRGQKLTILSSGGGDNPLGLGGSGTPSQNEGSRNASQAPGDMALPLDANAPATLLSEFNSGLSGRQVIAQLTSPLRVRGRILLPAGTRAQGTASVSIGQRGRATQVSISFNRFILPDGRIADGFSAVAGDPRTLSEGLTNVGLNRHYPAQVAGVVAASAFELLVGSLSQNRPSSFQQPSVFDESVARVRDRGIGVFAGEFEEGRWEPTVRIKKGTPMVLLFGLEGGTLPDAPTLTPGFPVGNN